MKEERKNLSIYVHIPFCRAKCSYCDFLSFGGCAQSVQKQYIEALCKEIDAYKELADSYLVQTIFFGGGTPSYVEAQYIVQVMQKIKDVFEIAKDAEITMEGNPDSLQLDHLKHYHACGVNRLSIGLQSTKDEMLKRIGRVHNFQQFLMAYENARAAGFQNINVDLMSGLPGETLDSYLETLKRVVELQPEHISAYSLIVEENTPLSENDALLDLIPNEEEDRKMYAKTKEVLRENGYERYEISNYARDGFACRHNLVYWTGGEYLGVGLGASSYMSVVLPDGKEEHIRFHGVENLDEYIGRFLQSDGMREDEYTDLYHYFEDGDALYDEYDSFYENMTPYKEKEQSAFLEFIRDYYRDLYFCKRKDMMEEFMFLGLRLMKGVSKEQFRERFGVTIESVYGKVLEKYYKQQLLAQSENGEFIYLTERGIDVSNVIMAEMML